MNPTTLMQRYRYQFVDAGDHIGYTFHKGWLPRFARLCEDVDVLLGPDKRGFRWVQLKEKLGSARWYFHVGDTRATLSIDKVGADGIFIEQPGGEIELGRRIRPLVHAAQEDTQTLCMACGRPGELDRGDGHILVVCEEHRSQRAEGTFCYGDFEESFDPLPRDGGKGDGE